MLDVDSKDPTVGMSSPPKVFIQPEFLMKLEKCLTTTGKTRILEFLDIFVFFSLVLKVF
jgi:hypothetical protein